jgi:GNS1/SUR4 family
VLSWLRIGSQSTTGDVSRLTNRILRTLCKYNNIYSQTCSQIPLIESSRQMVNLCYFFVLLKASYIIESVVGELGKRRVIQDSYMLYHHFAQTIMCWFCLNFYPGGHITLLILINCFVHVLLDTYYVTAVILFPDLKKRAKWIKNFFLYGVVRVVRLKLLTIFNECVAIIVCAVAHHSGSPVTADFFESMQHSSGHNLHPKRHWCFSDHLLC